MNLLIFCITFRVVHGNDKLKLLDVGSCYDPFRSFNEFDTTAIDISPANEVMLEYHVSEFMYYIETI